MRISVDICQCDSETDMPYRFYIKVELPELLGTLHQGIDDVINIHLLSILGISFLCKSPILRPMLVPKQLIEIQNSLGIQDLFSAIINVQISATYLRKC